MYARDLGWYRLLIVLPLLALVLLSQYYWLVRVWRVARRLKHPAVQNVFRAVCLLAFGIVLTIFVLNISLAGSSIHWRVSAVTAIAGLWISSSLFGYLAVKLVAAIAWLVHAPRFLAARFRPNANAQQPTHDSATPAPPHFSLSRRRFVQTVSAVAGAVPFAAGAYGFAFERLRYQIHRVDLPVSGLPPALEACASPS